MTPNAEKLLRERYAHKGETPEGVYKRVAKALAIRDERFEKQLLDLMLSGTFLPNSPAIRNAGKKKGMLSACFVIPIEDSIASIFDTVRNMAVIFQRGGGVGINFSSLRPKGAPLSGGGTSSGAISFMGIFNSITETVKQGGFRRGALMGILDYTHPEIMDFCRAKLKGDLTNFNISVMVTDDFMKMATTSGKVELKHDNIKYSEVRAKDILDLISLGTWVSGDPGMLFFDRINKDNRLYPDTIITGTNPCVRGDTLVQTVEGEIPIKDLVGKEIDVYSMKEDGTLCIRRATNIRKTGNKVIYKITTHRGSLYCTGDHLIFTRNRGWVITNNLKKGDRLAGLGRHMKNEAYCNVGLPGVSPVHEARFILSHYEDLTNRDVHHLDGNTLNNVRSNLVSISHSDHSKLSNKGHKDWAERDDVSGRFLKKELKSKRIKLGTGRDVGKNWIIKSVECTTHYEDVYDLTVEYTHNFIANGIVVHNCAEEPLPNFGACCLGSVNLTKFVDKDSFKFEEFYDVCKLGERALLNINIINSYPIPQITKTMQDLNSVGLGVMGLADTLIMLGINYDSEDALEFIRKLSKPYVEATEEVASESFYKRSIAPTGSLSILADCSSGIEPIFDIDFDRHLTIGTINETRDIYSSKYVRTARDIDPEWHLKIQAEFQKFVDSGVSKTINAPSDISVDDIKNIYIKAWKLGVKGITIFRDECKDGVWVPKSKIKCEGETCSL